MITQAAVRSEWVVIATAALVQDSEVRHKLAVGRLDHQQARGLGAATRYQHPSVLGADAWQSLIGVS